MRTLPFDCPRSCPRWGELACRFGPVLDAVGPVRVDSHVARVEVDVRDLDALAVAAQRCGLVLNRGQKTYRWFGEAVGDDLGKCDHAIGVVNPVKVRGQLPYEIGVVARQDGTGYDLLWDFFAEGYGLQRLAGEKCSTLIGEYLHAVAEKAAAQQGWLTERTLAGELLIYHPSGGVLTLSSLGFLEATGFQGGACHEARQQLGLPVVEGSIVETKEACQVAARVQLPA